MESDFLPKMAGEWLIEQIKMFKEFNNSKIIIVSASPIIKEIAERYKVLYLPKVYAKILIQKFINNLLFKQDCVIVYKNLSDNF